VSSDGSQDRRCSHSAFFCTMARRASSACTVIEPQRYARWSEGDESSKGAVCVVRTQGALCCWPSVLLSVAFCDSRTAYYVLLSVRHCTLFRRVSHHRAFARLEDITLTRLCSRLAISASYDDAGATFSLHPAVSAPQLC
jgi:hypothetical protein